MKSAPDNIDRRPNSRRTAVRKLLRPFIAGPPHRSPPLGWTIRYALGKCICDGELRLPESPD